MASLVIATTGYCGLNCGECFSYEKTVSEAEKRLRREIDSPLLQFMRRIWR